jgi:hypothetical protein
MRQLIWYLSHLHTCRSCPENMTETSLSKRNSLYLINGSSNSHWVWTIRRPPMTSIRRNYSQIQKITSSSSTNDETPSNPPWQHPFLLISTATSAIKCVALCAYSIPPRRPLEHTIPFISSWLIKVFFHFSIFFFYSLPSFIFTRHSDLLLFIYNTCIILYIPVKMKRERRESFPPTKFYSRNQESIFCKSDWTVWRAYHYESAKCQIRHPVRVQRGSVTRLGMKVVVSRVSGGDYQFSESVCIASRRYLECRILGGFCKGLCVTASAHPRWLLCIGCLLFEDFLGLLVDSSGSAWRFLLETWRVVYKCQDVLRPQV